MLKLAALILMVFLICIIYIKFKKPVSRGQIEDANVAYERGDYATAYRLIKPMAEQGNPNAQYNLGTMYMMGQGAPQDYTEAVKWFFKAAEQGEVKSMLNLGTMYDKGMGGIRRNHAEAVKCYRLAAEQGLSPAQYSLGLAYANGRGVPQDFTEAANWYRKAAEQGLYLAQSQLAAMYMLGKGVPQDYVLAHLWLNLAFLHSPEEEREQIMKGIDLLSSEMTPAQIAEAQRLAREWKPKVELVNGVEGRLVNVSELSREKEGK